MKPTTNTFAPHDGIGIIKAYVKVMTQAHGRRKPTILKRYRAMVGNRHPATGGENA
jgi:hypothetical protein